MPEKQTPTEQGFTKRPYTPRESQLIDRTLYWAIHRQETANALELLEQGAWCQYSNSTDPMECALVSDLEIARKFLELGADPNKKTIGNDPLFWHTNHLEQGRMPGIRLLVEHGADLHATNGQGRNFLHQLAIQDEPCLDTLQFLLQAGMNVHLQDEDKRTPLHVMAQYGWIEGMKLLLAHGADVRAMDHSQSSILHAVAEADSGHSSQVVELLVQAGASVDARNSNGKTPLMIAARNNHINSFMAFMAAGADVHAVDKSGQTARQIAESFDHQDVLACLNAQAAQALIDGIVQANGLHPLSASPFA
jgi:ankyrin repeat protein